MDTNRPTAPPPPQGPVSSPAAPAVRPPAGQPQQPQPAPASKIQHARPSIIHPGPPSGQGGGGGGGGVGGGGMTESVARMVNDNRPLPMAEGSAMPGGGKITAFGKERRHEECWSRTPNTTGVGAIHVKTFHCKLTEDALSYMDQTINEWLDAHPQYEVKFVSSTIGTLTGKLKEPALFCQVWV